MNISIDQSSKIENTNKNTVVAYANLKQKSLLIKAEDKKNVQKIFMAAGKPEVFIYKTFAVLIFLLIKDDIRAISSITIDIEYTGKESLIKDYLLQLLRKYRKGFDKEKVCFRRIGKKDNAHRVAIETFRGKRKADRLVRYKDVLLYLF